VNEKKTGVNEFMNFLLLGRFLHPLIIAFLSTYISNHE